MMEGGESNGRPQEIDRPGKIMVSGIPKDSVFTEADLEKEFTSFGRITEAYIVRDRRTHRSRGFAFITYENPTDAADASKAMEGKDMGGDRKIHCEQAVIGPRKSGDFQEDSFRGRGGFRGRGRGDMRGRGDGRGRGGGGRGVDRGGWRGGRGGGRGMDFGEFRGDPRGGRGFRGGMGFRGRGRGDFFEADMHGDNYYHHGDQGPPDMPRGRPGRRTLLPNPSFRGGHGQGPPHGPRGPPPMMHGVNDYYEEGPDGYRPDGYYDYGEERGSYERYDEGYQDEEYYEQPPYQGERMPQRGGGMGGRPFRGRGMGRPHDSPGMQRQEADYAQREEGGYPSRRGMAGGDYGGRGSAGMRRGGPGPAPPARRRDANAPEEYLPPRRRMADDYGYPAEDDQGMRQLKPPRRAPQAGQYGEDDYQYESRQRQADAYDNDTRGRAMPGRGGAASGRGGPAHRRAPLLGQDPYGTEEGASGYYEGQGSQAKASESYPDDGYASYSRGGPQTQAHRRPLTGADDSYGYEERSAARAPPARDDAYPQSHTASGSGGYDEGYQVDSLERRREEYDSARLGGGIRRSEMEYASRQSDYSAGGSDVYASYAPRSSRTATGSRDVEADPYSRKRHLDYEGDVVMAEAAEVSRGYQDFSDRSGAAMSGPSATKRDRYEGFYQARQEEVYREL